VPASSLIAATPEATAAAGEALGRTLGPGDVVALYGELGSGKTCFVQGLVRGLAVATHATSPTFVLVNEYRGRLPVHHVDAYRTSSPVELLDLGLLDLMGGDGVTLIEWAERAEPLLPERTVRVRLEGLGDEPRAIRIEDPRPAA
jgi:tRNA threonylcarbamoyladenosine biosynthesis protein TsaE